MPGFQKAERRRVKARVALVGPAGAGKTWTALTIAKGLGGKIGVIDTEHGSALNYADDFDFLHMDLEDYSPRAYVEAIKAAEDADIEVLILDSISHAWAGTGGALEMADRGSVKYSGNKWAAWREVTPEHNRFVEAMIGFDGHLIATLRAKMDYIQSQDDKGKTIIKKVGLAPIQRDGVEYEYSLVGEMDIDHNLIVTKTRYHIFDRAIITKPDVEFGQKLREWLEGGKPVEPKITEEQRKQIRDLAAKAGIKSADVPNLLMTDFGKDHTTKLTQAEADAFIAHLEAMVADKKESAA